MRKLRDKLFAVSLLSVILVSCSTGSVENRSGGVTPTAVTITDAETQGATAVAPDTEPPTATAIPTNTPEPTATPSPTPTITNTPQPTPTASPTLVPTPSPTPSPTPIPEPDWLAYLNSFRVQTGLERLSEKPSWSAGSMLHGRYIVETDIVKHHEEPDNQWFTQEGNTAARGNLAAAYTTLADYRWPIEYWFSAPFHGLPLLDPALEVVGFGNYTADSGLVKMASTLDMGEGHEDVEVDESVFPIFFPPDGSQTWIIRHSLPEFPEPWQSCPGFPTAYFGPDSKSGPPIMLQLGNGDLTPNVTASSLTRGGTAVEHCVFDETNYVNEKGGMQWTGRNILNKQDAIIMMPRHPLEVNETYSVSITANGQTYSWEFETINRPVAETSE